MSEAKEDVRPGVVATRDRDERPSSTATNTTSSSSSAPG